MSQNKTIISDSEFDIQKQAYADMGSNSEFYRPSGGTVEGTVIAGSDDGLIPPPMPAADTRPAGSPPSGDSQPRQIPLQDRVIIGTLFSISKGLLGEIFPIYLGRNMIGSSASCDICLKENTVSGEHAVLHAACEGYPGKCFLTLTDYGSTHGTMVNQRDCRYETMKVGDGDVLCIGRHYRLVMRLFDVSASGLYEDSDFESANSASVTVPVQSQTAYVESRSFYSPSQYGNNDNGRTVIG